MRRIREVLRLRYECGLQQRLISASVGISKGSVSDYLARAGAAGMTWAEAAALDEDEIERRLFTQLGRNEPPARVPIDFEWVHRELRRTGVTLQLLWVEYRDAALAANRSGRPYQYSQFCDLYADFRAKVEVSMRQVHRAGEKAFLDYSGKKPVIVDSATGEVIEVELFVMVLGASNYTVSVRRIAFLTS
jgi:transposase